MTKNTALICLLGLSLCLAICEGSIQAQVPTVGLTGITTLQSCPSGVGFYTADPNHPSTCSQGTISCPNTASIGITWSVANPGAPQGTIVFFSGSGEPMQPMNRGRSSIMLS